MLRLTTFLTALLTFNTSFSQTKNEMGILSSDAYYNYYATDGKLSSHNNKNSFSAGIYYQRSIFTPRLSLYSTLEFENKSVVVSSPYGNWYPETEKTNHFWYLTADLLFNYQLGMRVKRSALFIGGYYSHLINNTTELRFTNTIKPNDAIINTYLKGLNKYDIGVKLLYTYKLMYKLNLNVGTTIGLTNLSANKPPLGLPGDDKIDEAPAQYASPKETKILYYRNMGLNIGIQYTILNKGGFYDPAPASTKPIPHINF